MKLSPASNGFLTCAEAVLLVASFGYPIAAQTAAVGNIAGTVTDTSGAAVPGAAVVVTNTDTGVSRTLATGSDGSYSATFLQPGHYEVLLGGGGFGKIDRQNLTVTVGQVLTVDAALPTASVSTEVQVSTESPIIDTDKNQISQTIDQHLISNLPVNGRRWDNFVLSTPNVAPDGNTGLISYRGVSGLYNTNLVDGANNQQAFFSEARGRSIGAPYVYPLESIQEFQSSVSGYSAELGQAAGGIVNAITKSGTNQFHGDVFEYYRTPGWNALDPLNKYNGNLTRNPFLLNQPVKTQNQFGVSIGGPILKDKLFFHFTYDGYRKVNPITYLSTYNAATTSVANLAHLCDGGTTYVSDAGNIYPTTITGVSPTQCSQAVDFIQTKLLGSFARNTTQDIYFPRLDYQLNSKTHLSASFLFENFKQPNGYNTSTTVNNGSVTQNGGVNFHQRYVVANAETALTTNSANVVHFQWSRDLETASTNSGGPAMNIGSSTVGVAAYGETSALPRGAFPDEHRIQITDIYSTIFGKHSVKLGVDVNLIHEQIANLFGGDGSFTYSTGTVEAEFANWIQDVYQVNGGRHYSSFSQTTDPITGIGADDFWNKNLDIFVEDDWKVTPKLLLSLGARYDVQLVPQPDRPNTTSTPAFNATSVINTDYHMAAPRIGFAWSPHEGTVVRGGYGLFFGLTSNSTWYTLRRENGVYQQQFSTRTYSPSGTYSAITGAPTGGPNRKFSGNSGAVYDSFAPQGGIPAFTPPGPAPINQVTGAPTPALNPGLPASTLNIRGAAPNFLNPFTHSYDLAVEQQLPLHSTLSIGYVGTRGMRLPIFVDTNVDPVNGVISNRPYYSSSASGITPIIVPIYTKRLSTATGSILTGQSDVNSWYHSMAVSVRKPLSYGVEVLANYTWAKTMDGGQSGAPNGTFNGTDAPLIPFAEGHRQGRGAEYARSDIDQRGRFVGSIVATSKLPIANRYAAYAANGWQLSGSYTAQTGFPVTGFINGTISSALGGGDGGVTGAVLTSGTGTRVPDQIARRNSFTGPGVHNLDSRISRSFPVHEGMAIEVAAEAFNVLNHRNILSVNNSLVNYTAASTPTSPTSCNFPGSSGCFTPNPSFGAPTSTSNILYGPRQVQLLGRFVF
ncbi:TonB-dependent receptor [Tunturibacter empetritectus]|uniref:TonB-dependent receptor n=1 Tax=Tunturiibacter empetritectus TaxID=3069691 RepID=A0AAU7Z947_9BACT